MVVACSEKVVEWIEFAVVWIVQFVALSVLVEERNELLEKLTKKAWLAQALLKWTEVLQIFEIWVLVEQTEGCFVE